MLCLYANLYPSSVFNVLTIQYKVLQYILYIYKLRYIKQDTIKLTLTNLLLGNLNILTKLFAYLFVCDGWSFLKDLRW